MQRCLLPAVSSNYSPRICECLVIQANRTKFWCEEISAQKNFNRETHEPREKPCSRIWRISRLPA
jgi:hypothetical protein